MLVRKENCMQKTSIIFIFTLLLSACTSHQVRQQIQQGDWFAVGESDASNGYIEESKAHLEKTNDKYNEEKLDYDAYLAGYEKALSVYCEPQNAYTLALLGQPYYRICDRYPHGWTFYQDWWNTKNARKSF